MSQVQRFLQKVFAIGFFSLPVAVILLFTLGTSGLHAQSAGLRAVRTPESASDTGAAFDEMAHFRNAQKYFMDRATSGEVKDWGEVLRIGEESFSQMNTSIAYKTLNLPAWQQVGGSISSHASGRARSIAFDPKNGDIAYLATASGGLWKTTNATSPTPTWVSLSDGNLPILWMGAVAVDPNDGQTVYAGTGEVFGGWSPTVGNTTSTPPGTGIYKSTDGGMNWALVDSVKKAGTSCGQILVDFSNSKHVFAATGNSTGGLQVSTDGGTTWSKATTAGGDPVCIVIDPTNAQNVYVGLQSGGIYRSADGGQTWTKCTIAGGTGSIATTRLAIAPSSPNILYASISSGSGFQGSGTYGIFKSEDRGVTWAVMNKCNQSNPNAGQPVSPANPSQANNFPQANFLWVQGHYGNAIAVNPQNPAEIVVGGIDIWSSQDSGKTLKTVGFSSGDLTQNYYCHADVHDLVYQGNLLWTCTDGGIANSVNSGGTWVTTVNHGLATLQFVGVDADPNFTYVLGGTQDNGVERCYPLTSTAFELDRYGDGGLCWIDPQDPSIAYSTYVFADFEVSHDSGIGNQLRWDQAPNGTSNFITNTTLINEVKNGNNPFYPPYDASFDGSVVVYGGNSHVFVSQNGGIDGFPNESATNGISPNVIYCYPSDPTIAWEGSYNGKVYHSLDVTNTQSHWTGSAGLGGGVVSGVVADPNDPSNVFAVVSGVGGTNKHFYVSADTGKTWSSPATGFPSVSCNSIAISPTNNALFVGTDVGVLYSLDTGKTWTALTQGMPHVQVNSLKVRGLTNQYLLAGTYGRGMFYINITGLPPSNGDIVVTPGTALPTVASLDESFPNPLSIAENGKATIGFTLVKGGIAKMTLHDVLGREVQVLANAAFSPGHHAVTLSSANLAAGTYICALTTSGVTLTEKISVIK